MNLNLALTMIVGVFIFGFGTIGWAVAFQLSKEISQLKERIDKFYGTEENRESESPEVYVYSWVRRILYALKRWPQIVKEYLI